MKIRNEPGSIEHLQQVLKAKGISFLSFHVESKGQDDLELFLDIE
ncbi:hypothetical protein ACFQI7_28490 [Paenibacillus allorhizosphaerae]|nr:hypothetical protein [Paenibacillus allorhizosphaerae]